MLITLQCRNFKKKLSAIQKFPFTAYQISKLIDKRELIEQSEKSEIVGKSLKIGEITAHYMHELKPDEKIASNSLERLCRWPLGEPGNPDFHFCEEPTVQPYHIFSSIA